MQGKVSCISFWLRKANGDALLKERSKVRLDILEWGKLTKKEKTMDTKSWEDKATEIDIWWGREKDS